jgi:hypothetical protein
MNPRTTPTKTKAQVEVTRLGAWVMGLLLTAVVGAIIAVTIHLMMAAPAGDTLYQIVAVAIMTAGIGLYAFYVRRILKRRFTARVGAGYIPPALMKIERLDD